MRIKTARIAGAMIASIMVIGSYVSTPVFAGTTKSDLAAESQDRIDQDFVGKTLDYTDTAFAVLDTIAEKTGTYTDGRNTYTAKVDYQIYFNLYRDDTKTEKHAFSLATMAYRITPSGGKTTDVTKWPFPMIENNYENAQLKQIVKRDIIEEVQYFDDSDFYCNNTPNGNTKTIKEDAQEGVLTFRTGLDLLGRPGDRPYENYVTYIDPNTNDERTYHNAYFMLKNIVGKPGDKLQVEVFHFYNTRVKGSPASLTLVPYVNLIYVDRAKMDSGVVISSGYIYIPYNVTYDLNGGTGQAPVVATGEIFTSVHNKVKVPVKDNTFQNGDAELLGWSPAPVSGLVTDTSGIEGFTPVGEDYTITGDEDVVLYAVWGKTVPAGATLNLETRGHKQGEIGSTVDKKAYLNGGNPTYVQGSKFTLKKLDANGNVDTTFTPVESDATGADGKVSFTGLQEGTYQLKQSAYGTGWNNYKDSAWKVKVTKSGDDYSVDVTQEDGATEWQMAKDGSGQYTGNMFPAFDEWYWTKTARTEPTSWEGFWKADPNTLLIYNIGDGIVPTGLGGQGGVSVWEWVLGCGIAGGIVTGIVVRHRMRRRHQQ